MTTENAIESFILDEILIGSDQTKLDPDQSLLDSGILDSLALLRLIGFLEDHYQIEIGDGEVTPDNFETLATLSAYVQRKKAE